MYVGEGRRVSQHLDVECPDQMLLDLFGRQIFFGQSSLESGQFSNDDAVLFLLGLGLSYLFD